LTDQPDYEIDRRRHERREIDAHRAELVETVDRLNARAWRRDVLFLAVGILGGAILSALVGLVLR
jgi:hypothetical protein